MTNCAHEGYVLCTKMIQFFWGSKTSSSLESRIKENVGWLKEILQENAITEFLNKAHT